MKTALWRYLLRVEAFLALVSLVAAGAFYVLHGPVPALRMLVGSFLVSNLALAWVFRASIFAIIRRLWS